MDKTFKKKYDQIIDIFRKILYGEHGKQIIEHTNKQTFNLKHLVQMRCICFKREHICLNGCMNLITILPKCVTNNKADNRTFTELNYRKKEKLNIHNLYSENDLIFERKKKHTHKKNQSLKFHYHNIEWRKILVFTNRLYVTMKQNYWNGNANVGFIKCSCSTGLIWVGKIQTVP